MKENLKILRCLLLFPLSVIYGLVVSIRNFCYENNILKSKQYNIPIISIGNLSVGGTGKTPHTEFLLKMLSKEFSVAVLSRGYKRKTKGFRIVETDDTHFESGDEPLQIKRKYPDSIVAVSESRTKGVETLLKMYPDLNLIILDDAFQHRRIKPGLQILLNNYNHPIAEDYLLPLGMLRETRSASYRADIIIYSKCPNNLKPIERRILSKEIDIRPFQYLFFSTFDYLDIVPIYGEGDKIINKEKLKELNVLALSGIARSKNFVDYLKENCKIVKHLRFPDHHNFNKRDISNIEKEFNKMSDNKIILVTEKDAIRLNSMTLFSEDIKKYVYCIPIEVKLLCSEDDRQQFDNQIFSYVRNNKRYSKLYKNSY
ncbi:MAG: tetraacyldisaccharide 4'-kinase [Bacteroidales bacterium]|nr:tetraacyldisaccharide 4'-kinase [Bacteroidales bacterium]MDD4217136.1 tetraacyldisaccharide 4'-kinase [Bacteroidales bacterium]MDY0141691.1 tetraacyldisaccharide 4'-kinase [Bacteroidales bacterium]